MKRLCTVLWWCAGSVFKGKKTLVFVTWLSLVFLPHFAWKTYSKWLANSCDDYSIIITTIHLLQSFTKMLKNPWRNEEEYYFSRMKGHAMKSECLLLESVKFVSDRTWHHVWDNFEACVFCLSEWLTDGPDCMSSVGIPCHVLVDGLDPDFQTGASVWQHVRQVSLQTVVRPGLDGDPDALGHRLLRVTHGFGHGVRRVPRQRVM